MKENIIKYKLQLNVYFFMIKTFAFIQIIKICKFSCDESAPFLKGEECLSFCSLEEINNKTCEINYDKLKIQWISNIIYFSDENWVYINPMISQNNDLIILLSSFPESNERLLYGITKEGRGYFNELEFHKMEINDPNTTGRFESEAFMIKLLESTDNKEYILSFGKGIQFMEIYDIENEKIYFKQINNVFQPLYDVHQISGAFVKMANSSNNYLIGLLSKVVTTSTTNSYLKIFTFNITSLSDEDITLQFDYKEKQTSNSKMVSCYESAHNSIVCFYRTTTSYTFYGYNLEKKTQGTLIVFSFTSKEEEKFFKCVHYTSEIGAFLYYNTDKEPKAVIALGEFKTTGCVAIKTRIEIKNYIFNYNNLLNDIVKISDGKIFFAAVSKDMKSLYIISIHNVDETSYLHYIERIYHVNSFIYNDYNFNTAIRLTIFNNYLTFCSNGLTSNEKNFSSLIIFSYPNSTDLNQEITNLLLNDNETNINNITIDFKKLCLIENNIFGLSLTGFKIIEIYNNSEDVCLLSSIDNKEIPKGKLLSLDDKLKLFIQKNNNVYNKFSYGIKYSCVASEPIYKEYNNYTIYFEDKLKKGEGKFTQETYNGRYTFYNFSLNNQLTDEGCNKGCELCYHLNENKCITCEFGLEYELLNDHKICFVEQNSTELITTSFIESDTTTTELTTDIKTIEASYTELETSPSESEVSTAEKISTNEIGDTTYTELETNPSEQDVSTTEYILEEKSTNKIVDTSYTELETNPNESDISTTENIIEEISTNKIVDTSKTEIVTEFISQNHSDEELCSAKEIIQGICKGELTDEMAEEIYNYIKNNLINSNFTDGLFIQTPSYKFHLSTQEFINNFGNLSSSKINLGECENKLKEKYNISDEYSLIIFKIDIENSDKSFTFVQYEVYNPETYKELSLDVCDNILINITIPAKLDSETQFVYEKLKGYGYNLFDINDKFYNDICTPYTTENNTDMLLTDRRNDIYNKYGNKTICQEGCNFASYNGNSEEATCQCQPQTNKTDLNLNIGKNFNVKGIGQVFFKTLNNSNFRVLKCYKVAIDLNTIKENKGRLMMTLILIIFIILFIIFIIKGNRQLLIYIQQVLEIIEMSSSKDNNLLKKETKKEQTTKTKLKKIDKNDKNKNLKKTKTKTEKEKTKGIDIIKKYIQTKIKKIAKQKSNPLKRSKTKVITNRNKNKEETKLNKVPTKEYKKPKNNIDLVILKKHYSKQFKQIPLNSQSSSRFSINYIRRLTKMNSYNLYSLSNIKSNKNNNLIKDEKKFSLNDQELNSLDYKKAMIYDKRTYFQYYWSLLKKKHMIFFAFVPVNDYNLQYLKISLLLLSFSLSFNINGFFFSDKTMHKIYEDEGAVNYLYQISEIIITTVISSVISIALKKLSLIEDTILRLKKRKKSFKGIQKLRKAHKCIKIQFAIFFVFSFLLLFFFWYFISCFCGVYVNTQNILINDTLISFGLSMIYPFGLNLLPGLFRIPALRSKKKDKECMYKISRYFSLI